MLDHIVIFENKKKPQSASNSMIISSIGTVIFRSSKNSDSIQIISNEQSLERFFLNYA